MGEQDADGDAQMAAGAALPPPRFDKQLKFAKPSPTPHRIRHVQFGVLSASEVTRASHIEVSANVIYDDLDRSVVRGSALDPRLGALTKQHTCETCGRKQDLCPGHFGYVRLCLPVFHAGFFKATLQILQMICKACARVMLHHAERVHYLARLQRKAVSAKSHIRGALLREVWEKSRKSKRCPHCEAVNGTVKKVGALRIVHYPLGNKPPAKKRDDDDDDDDFNDRVALYDPVFKAAMAANAEIRRHITKAADDLNPQRVLHLFERIPSEDVLLLDMSPDIGRPERLIVRNLPVPPLCVRPTVMQDANLGSTEDDLTMAATEIAHLNNVLAAEMAKGLSTHRAFDMWDQLQVEVARYFNSETPGLPNPQSSQKPIRGVSQRLKGKAGRFRGNLSGKRVDFSGRTVISPDPNLEIDEVGIPVHVAKILIYPERVTKFNIDKLRAAVLNGPDKYPGANHVYPKGGYTKVLRFGKLKDHAKALQIGDVVDRHLINGDIVLFNRQPSLHRISIMCHRVRVGNHRTFRFNECVCSPYNADFDGDEMNLHVPQTEEARAEALELMSVLRNLITPRNGEPIVAAIQDFITASYLITSKDVFMDRAEFYQAICMMSNADKKVTLPAPCIVKPIELWSGKQVFTTLVRNAALQGKHRPASDSDLHMNAFFASLTVEVKEKGFSAKPHMVPQMCLKDGYVYFRSGELLCGQLGKKSLGSGSKKSVFYILQRDYGVDAAAYAMSCLARLSARWLADAGFSIGVDDVSPSESLRMEKERLVREGYRKCERFMQELKDGTIKLRPGCTPEETLESQLNSELSSIREEAGKACLAEIDPSTNAALTMALCGSKGSNINISQMVSCVGQQTVGGSRAPNGFFGRALPHFELGLNAKSPIAKGFVSNSFFSGMTPTEFFFHTMGGREGLVDTAVKTAETGYMQRRLMKALEDLSVQYDNTVRSSGGKVVQMRYGDDGLDPSEMESDSGRPVNFAHLLESVKCAIPVDYEKMFSASELREYARTTLKAKEKKYLMDDLLPNFGMRFFLNSALEFLLDVAKQQEKEEEDVRFAGLTQAQVDEFIRRMDMKFAKGEVEPGSAVGAIGAQSIGEPGTQMTLKTFHFAGVASMNITQGVPRLKEIINASKTIATPVIDAALVSDRDVKSARVVKGRVERTFLGEIAEYIKEVYRAGSSYIAVKIDMDLVLKLGLEIDLIQVATRISEYSYSKLKVLPEDIVLIRPDKLRICARPRGEGWKSISGVKTTREMRKKIELNRPFYLLQSLKLQLPHVAVQGVSGVGRAVIQEEGGKYRLLVESDDLANVMTVPGIDGVRATSNHVISVEKTLGIEAARATIMLEIIKTMQAHGMTIDERHVKLLADCMTSGGTVLGIQRFGIQKMKSSTLMLASFEMTVEHLFHAAVFSKKDEVVGVSERIIMGLPIPLGTGLFEMMRKATGEAHNNSWERRPTLLADRMPKIVGL